MKDVKKMTDQELWNWMTKSIRTCQNVMMRYDDYEKACFSDAFYNARQRYDLVAEEFSERDLLTETFEPLYQYTKRDFEMNFFSDSMA